MFRVEFDDGKPVKANNGRDSRCTPKGRSHGFYVIYPDGQEEKVEIGYMRISEMEHLQAMLNTAWLMGRSI